MSTHPYYMIPGFHGVREALIKGEIKIQELWIAQEKKSVRIQEIVGIARERNISVTFKKGSELSRLLPDTAHQGIVALAERFRYSELDRIIDISLKAQDKALLIAADHVTDEGNLGSLIRTAAFFGAHGMIIPKDRSASVSSKVLKRSSGACMSLPITRVVNMGRALDLLRSRGFWVIGASGEGSVSVYRFDWDRNLVLVLGSEQRGLSRTIRERCDQVVAIPSPGVVESLNVAVAEGVILSEIIRQRKIF